MRPFRNRDFMALILGLLVAGGLAGWAASVAVNYFDQDDTTQERTVDPE